MAKIRTDQDMTYKTYMGWIKAGRGIKKGEKAALFTVITVNGKQERHGLFEQAQTIKLNSRYISPEEAVRNYFKLDGYYDQDASGLAAFDARQLNK